MMLACPGVGAAPMIRMPDALESSIQKATDLGAIGIIVPTVDDALEARDAARFSRYPPFGRRSSGGGSFGQVWPGVNYRATVNDNMLVTVMIETLEGVANAEEIAATHGVDVVLIGNNDLSSFSGWPQNDPRYQDALIKVRDAALKYGKYFGNAGAQYLNGYVLSADTRMVQNGPARDGWTPPREAAARVEAQRRPDAAAVTARPSPMPEPVIGLPGGVPPASAPAGPRSVAGLVARLRRRIRPCLGGAGCRRSRGRLSGVYTAAQADAGEKVYFDQCVTCHGDDLGGRERAPALAGAPFVDSWSGKDLRRLLERIEVDAARRAEAVLRRGRRRARVPPARFGDAERSDGPADRSRPARRDHLRTRARRRVALRAAEQRRATVNVMRLASSGSPWPRRHRGRPGSLRGGAQARRPPPGRASDWPTYGGNLASHRYSPADQITKDNFNRLGIAWRLKTDFLGPRPDTLYSATPLVVDRVLYTTAGMRRAAIALDAVTGEMLWMHAEDEGVRGQNAPRTGAGRGLAYWAGNGTDRRVIYVTPGYRMLALDARTGHPIPTFGQRRRRRSEARGRSGGRSRHGGARAQRHAARRRRRHRRRRRAPAGHGAADDAQRERAWCAATTSAPASGSGSSTPSRDRGEFGYDTWLENSAEYNGNTGVWAQMSADAELGLVYVPVEMPTGDYYGGNRPGDNLFADSLVALDVKTGRRKWHYQTVHHDVWDWDLACAPILFDMTVNGRTVKAIAQPTKHAFLFVFNRETGEPIWPIEERPVPQSDVPKERTSPTQPFPTRPAPFDRQGVTENDLLDLTPALKAEALEVVKRYKMGPLFTPPV